MSGKIIKKIGGYLACGLLAIMGEGVFAASSETPSGTTVSNTVTVNYNVGTVAQPAQTATRDFLVDNKVNLVVTGTGVNTVANATDAVLTYTVTNTGNTTQGYSLAVEAGSPDTFDMNSVRIYIEDGTTPGFQLAEDTLYTSGSGLIAFNLTQTAGTDSKTVYVVANTPPNGGGTAPANGATAAYNLKATTLNAGVVGAAGTVTTANTGSADTANSVDVVFADDNGGTAGPFTGDTVNNGVDSARAVYTISSSELTVAKTSVVVSDPVNNTTNPKAIPGAVMRYTITIINSATASAAASNVVMSDGIPSNTTYVPGTITLDTVAKTDVAADDEAEFSSNTVTVTIPSIAVNTTKTITFDVTIN